MDPFSPTVRLFRYHLPGQLLSTFDTVVPEWVCLTVSSTSFSLVDVPPFSASGVLRLLPVSHSPRFRPFLLLPSPCTLLSVITYVVNLPPNTRPAIREISLIRNFAYLNQRRSAAFIALKRGLIHATVLSTFLLPVSGGSALAHRPRCCVPPHDSA